MISALSYLIACLLTAFLAFSLYPIAAMFWVGGMLGKALSSLLGLFSKIAEGLFDFTSRVIRYLWKDLHTSTASEQKAPAPQLTGEQWQCACGAINAGKFCSCCGAKKPEKDASADATETDPSDGQA